MDDGVRRGKMARSRRGGGRVDVVAREKDGLAVGGGV